MAVIIGSTIIVILFGLTQPAYPEPFNMVWFLLAGSSALQSSLFNPLTPVLVVLYIVSWLIIGIVIGPFSKPGCCFFWTLSFGVVLVETLTCFLNSGPL
ncbi:MAG: hypothetical protein ACXACG_05295 [Candidatus Thorarchaeota archaeon]